jgi:hypothetical protein
MIEFSKTSSPDQFEIRFSGQVSQSDYEQSLVPALEAALAENDDIRVLAILDDSFTGFDLGAAWADTKTGLSHWRGFERIAVASDVGWVRVGVRAMAPLFPCPIQVFALSEVEQARRWLRESLGAIHVTELGGTAVQVQVMGTVDRNDFEHAQEGLSAHVRKTGGLRLLLDLREFGGWEGISALGAHLNVARAHAGEAERIAMVGDKAWQHMAQRVASKVLKAETRFFEAAQYEAAKVWVAR